MNWQNLDDIKTLTEIDKKSSIKPQLIFKHSTRCSISSTVKNRLQKIPNNLDIDCYYLDLLQHRNISNTIAEQYKVHHESPQVLLIQNGESVFDESQLAIDWEEIAEQIK